MPFFYKNLENNLDLKEDLMGKIIEIVIFAVGYFTVAYSLLAFVFKTKEINDERDDMINSKSYKLGYLLYEFSLFVFIGIRLINTSLQNNGGIIFLILSLLLAVSIIKSIYQLYLYRSF